MTQKHFIAIARIIDETPRESHPLIDEVLEAVDRDREKITVALADYFRTVNANFDRSRFLRACGVN